MYLHTVAEHGPAHRPYSCLVGPEGKGTTRNKTMRRNWKCRCKKRALNCWVQTRGVQRAKQAVPATHGVSKWFVNPLLPVSEVISEQGRMTSAISGNYLTSTLAMSYRRLRRLTTDWSFATPHTSQVS